MNEQNQGNETPLAPKNETAPRQKDGASLIAAERQRQLSVEGWTPEHDDEHTGAELGKAGVAYAFLALLLARGVRQDEALVSARSEFPWDDEWWKPSDSPIRNLEKAGALIAAEIDRLLRLKTGEGETVPSAPIGPDAPGVSSPNPSSPSPSPSQVSEEGSVKGEAETPATEEKSPREGQFSLTELLDQIDQRANAATPGPWKVSNYRPFSIIQRDPHESTYERGDNTFTPFIHFPTGTFDEKNADSNFIAAARSDVPKLVKALRMAVTVIKDLAVMPEVMLRSDFLIDCDLSHLAQLLSEQTRRAAVSVPEVTDSDNVTGASSQSPPSNPTPAVSEEETQNL